jgi:hypothetical protein
MAAPEPETLTLRPTVIAGQRYADYQVRWCGLPVGRIVLGSRAPHDRPPWSWSCHLPGRPQGNDDRGSATDLADAKAKFKAAWARIRSDLTEAEIADARRVAEISAKVVARYDRKGRARNRPIGRASSMSQSRFLAAASSSRSRMPGPTSRSFRRPSTRRRSGKRPCKR